MAFWQSLLHVYYAIRLRVHERRTRAQYDDIGDVVARIAKLPYVIITQSPLSTDRHEAQRKTTEP